MVEATWQGTLQNVSRGASTLLVLATSLVVGAWFAAQGRPGWTWFYRGAIPVTFVALTAVGLALGGNPVALALLATPWVWVTALAVHLRTARSSVGVPS